MGLPLMHAILASVEAIRREQARDPFAKDLLARLEIEESDCVTVAEGCAPRSGAALRLAKFASLDGILFRVTEASDPKEGYDSARLYVPPDLRVKVIRSMHSGVFGAHRNAKATHKEVVERYWWPSLKDTWKCRSVLGTTPRCRPLDQSVTDSSDC